MSRLVKLIILVTLFAGISGGLLSILEAVTKERIEMQQLLYLKGPALKEVMSSCSNDPLKDRIKIKEGDKEHQIFICKVDGRPSIIATETFGKGYKGPIGVVVGIDIEKDKLVGIGVTTHTETPGLGARAKTDKAFKGQFKGKSLDQTFKVKSDGGEVDALSGATITSKGVCLAVEEARALYKRLKPEILKNLGKV